jgi:endonuclease/exonuclease/phosphatase family metal-dependent hydrolase
VQASVCNVPRPKGSILCLLLLILLFLLPSQALAEGLRIASWNIQNLGQGQQKSYPALVTIASRFDLLAIQEVMNAEAVKRLQAELKQATGEEWGLLYSHLIGRGSYQEKYAFVWRESAVRYVDGAVVYIDKSDKFIREPFAARFETRDGKHRFVLATVHILYGRSINDRIAEIRALASYWKWLREVFPKDPNILLAGDFNLPPTHEAWQAFAALANPLITSGATTLSSYDGKYANFYDNIWISKDSDLPVRQTGIFRFPEMLRWNHEKSRRHVSDHAPVFFVIGEARVDGSAATNLPEPYTGADQLRVKTGNPASAPTEISAGEALPAIIGNRNSQIFHRPDCPNYGDVAPRNRVPFETEAQAVKAGFRRAANCP